jgi:EF-hand domain
MRMFYELLLVGGFLVAASSAGAQPPPGPPGGGRGEGGTAGDAGPFVTRMMRFDTNQDGKLARDEMADPRLQSLFDRADSDKDGVVTKDELTAFFTRESANLGPRGGPGFGGGPPGGFGGPGGGRGGPPGQVMPMFLQEMLQLSDDQKKQVAELQKEVDARLETILNADQKQQLKAMRDRGPGGPGGGFGPPPGGRRGGPGGGPPGGGPPGRPGRGPGPDPQ